MGSSRCCGALSSLSSSSSISALMAPTTLAPSRHLSVLPAPRMPVASRLVSQRRQFHRSGPCAAGGKWSAREDSKLFFPLPPKQIRWANSTKKKTSSKNKNPSQVQDALPVLLVRGHGPSEKGKVPRMRRMGNVGSCDGEERIQLRARRRQQQRRRRRWRRRSRGRSRRRLVSLALLVVAARLLPGPRGSSLPSLCLGLSDLRLASLARGPEPREGGRRRRRGELLEAAPPRPRRGRGRPRARRRRGRPRVADAGRRGPGRGEIDAAAAGRRDAERGHRRRQRRRGHRWGRRGRRRPGTTPGSRVASSLRSLGL